MKKLISILLAVMLIAVLATTAFAAGDPYVSVSSVTTNGENVTLTVKINNNPGFFSYEGQITLENNSPLELVSITPGALNGSYSTTTGIVTHGSGGVTTGDVVLFTATFKVVSLKNTNANVTVRIYNMRNGDGQRVNVTSGTGTVTIKVPTCSTHTYGEYTGTEATCTEAGVKTATCTVCGYEDTKTTPMLRHKGGTATCSAKAICDTCGQEYGEKLDHKLTLASDSKQHWQKCTACSFTTEKENHKGGTATCVAKAECEVCGAQYDNLADHNLIDASDSTQHWQKCTATGCTYTTDKEDHNGGKATCVELAECADCGAQYGKKDANNHVGGSSLKDVETATCTREGFTGNMRCNSCNAILEAGATTGKAAHDWDNGVVVVLEKETCAKEGKQVITCATCKTETKTEIIEVSEDHIVNKATDNKDGTHTAKCACGTVSSTAKHNYSQPGKVTVPATTTSEGKQEMHCECGAKTTKTLAKLTSTEGELDDVPPTGDITMQITLGVVAMISMAAAAVFVFNRKIAK